MIMLIDYFSSGLSNRLGQVTKPGKPGQLFSKPGSRTDSKKGHIA
jgi:hypothetical protein